MDLEKMSGQFPLSLAQCQPSWFTVKFTVKKKVKAKHNLQNTLFILSLLSSYFT